MGATELWAATVAKYTSQTLVELTNADDRSGDSVSTAVGEVCAQEVIDLWPIYAHVTYDDDDAQHVAVAVRGVVAVLMERGGASPEAAKAKFDEVFGGGGLIEKMRQGKARARITPTAASADSNVDVTRAGWGDSSSLPAGILPSRQSSDED